MATRPFIYPRNGSFRIRCRGGLPHWELDRGIYFVTWRLADSLPAAARSKIRDFRSRQDPLRYPPATSAEKLHIQRLIFGEFEKWLDRGLGSCVLRDERASKIIRDALHFFDGERYQLISWAIMPNHVHVVFMLFKGSEIGRVVSSWKRFTARECNRLLGRSGSLWQRDYYDRLVRDMEELQRTVRYVMNNPAKAGLDPWPWTWMRDDLELG